MLEKNNDGYEQAIRQLNYENKQILTSSEYRIGNIFIRYFKVIKKLQIITLFKMLYESKRIKQSNKLYTDIHEKIECGGLNEPIVIEANSDKTITIYTCIIGDYDAPKPPLIIPKNYKFILFTNMNAEKVPGWEIRKIPDRLKCYNPTFINRYIKFHPREFFNTDYTMYIDGNVRLLVDISDLIQVVDNSKIHVGMYDHSVRNCLYREAQVCKYLGKGNKEGIEEQVKAYSQEGMPHSYGLKEATVILANMHDENAGALLDAWWKEFNRWSSNRDQLSLPYVIWKMGMKLDSLGNLGKDVKNDLHFQISFHKSK